MRPQDSDNLAATVLKRPAAQAAQHRTGGVPPKLGRYVIEREIGRGAMAVVYLGRDPQINRVVAVKALPLAREFGDEELDEARRRFFREAESAGRLNHPGIVTVYDAGEDQGLAYIAMEYLSGLPLSEFTDSSTLLPPSVVTELIARVAEALAHAHRPTAIFMHWGQDPGLKLRRCPRDWGNASKNRQLSSNGMRLCRELVSLTLPFRHRQLSSGIQMATAYCL